MGPLFDIAIMVVNYSHDIATALLAVSAAALWIIAKNYPAEGGSGANAETHADAERYFLDADRYVTRLAKYSLAWVLLAGVPRVIFYKSYEWSNIAGGLQVLAIAVKHVVMFLLVGVGLYYWFKVRRRVRELRLKHNTLRG